MSDTGQKGRLGIRVGPMTPERMETLRRIADQLGAIDMTERGWPEDARRQFTEAWMIADEVLSDIEVANASPASAPPVDLSSLRGRLEDAYTVASAAYGKQPDGYLEGRMEALDEALTIVAECVGGDGGEPPCIEPTNVETVTMRFVDAGPCRFAPVEEADGGELQRLRERNAILEAALIEAVEGDHEVAFVVSWEDAEGNPRVADPGCVVVQCDDLYGAQFAAPNLAAYLRERTQEGTVS